MRQRINPIKGDMMAALAEVGKKHNVQFTFPKVTYDDNAFWGKITITQIESDGTVMTEDAKKFNEYAFLMGDMQLGDRLILSNGIPGVISGYRPRSPKFPILVDGEDGRTYKATLEGAKASVEREKAA